ncbi:MAG: hypothetical protein ACRYGP_16015 [Janthinobacterium lividum]
MTNIKTVAAVAALATLALAATDLSASAQSTLTNGPDGMRPTHSRAMVRHKAMRHEAQTNGGYASRRPLTVRRTVVAGEAPVVVVPVAPVVNTGPGTIVTGPLGFGSNIVSLPFRVMGGIFPATGDVASNPLVLIGAPLRVVGDIVQLPFRIIGAPFGGTTLATY